MFAHLGNATVVVVIIELITFVISDARRWRRFLFLMFLLLAIAAGWWLLADGGLQVILHDFGPVSITHHAAALTARDRNGLWPVTHGPVRLDFYT